MCYRYLLLSVFIIWAKLKQNQQNNFVIFQHKEQQNFLMSNHHIIQAGYQPSNNQFYNKDNCPRKKIQQFSYLLNDSIGKGYSSHVYCGRNDRTNEPVAIKVIDMKMLRNQVHQTLLASQIACLKKLKRSTYVIDLIEVYTTKNNTYLITQYCQDGDLSSIINNRKMSEKQAIFYMQQLIKGYLEIYKKGIIHRDLKPANILLNGKNIKIADFGFSIRIQDNLKTASYNVGSPLYMPPQTILQNKYTYKSDIWALGITYFQMLTGRAPWKAKTQKQLANKILNNSIKDLLPLDLSQPSVNFLVKTLNPNYVFRMTAQQLQNFSFVDSIPKSTRYNNSQKTDSTINKSDRKTNSINMNQKNIKFHNSTLPSITNDIPQNQAVMKAYRKQISKQVLSYVHLCRFLYKLIGRLQNYGQVNSMQQLKIQLSSLINYKINGLLTFQKINIYQVQNYKQFKQSLDFNKIINIVKQYETKYKQSLEKYKYGKSFQDYSSINRQITAGIRKIYIKIQNITEDQVIDYEDQIIILDYLITTYQLINLDATKDLKQFSKKSKIEAIVQGTTNMVTYDHFTAIKQKMSALNFI